MTMSRSGPTTRVRLALLLSILAPAGMASPGLGDEPPPAPKGYREFVRARADAIWAGDGPPATLDQWRSRREAIRKGLLAAWGGFPADPCPLEPRVLGTLDRDGYRVEKVVFQTRPGVWMTANAYVPDAPGRRPAILAVHGHWRGAKQDPVVQARCIGAAKLGFFVLAVDAFGAGERGVGEALGEYHGEMTGATLLPVGLPLSGLQVYENARAVDYLRTRPEVDGDRIGITGASGGGNQSMYAGAWDERLRAVVPVCSVGTYRSYLGAACCICELVPGAMRLGEEWGVLGLAAPRGLLIVNATQDATQFSVAESKRSLAPLEKVFGLYDRPGHVKHAVFESKHDYSKPMREAMYGWMTLHLKGEGDGAPIAEPELKTEDPETLRCYPGDSRPDDWMTLPRFAAAEARKLLAARPTPADADGWRTEAEARRKALVETVFGGSPTAPLALQMILSNGGVTGIVFDPEPGVTLTATLVPVEDKAAPLAIVIDLDGVKSATYRDLAAEVRRSGWRLATVEPRATGWQAVAGDKIGQAPDHNSAEWAMWIGRPLLGQWVLDVRRLIDAVEQVEGTPPRDVILIGRGPAGLVALCAAAVDPRVTKVAAVGTLASYVTDAPYEGQRLGVMAPGILREVGDVAHLAALCAPRRVVIAGGVAGNGQVLSADELQAAYRPAAHAWNLLGVPGGLSVFVETAPAQVIKAMMR